MDGFSSVSPRPRFVDGESHQKRSDGAMSEKEEEFTWERQPAGKTKKEGGDTTVLSSKQLRIPERRAGTRKQYSFIKISGGDGAEMGWN